MDATNSTALPDTETDKRLTFCISFNHLDAALELGNLPKFSSCVLFTFEYLKISGALPTKLTKSSLIAPEPWNYKPPVLQDFANIKDIEPLAQPKQATLPVIRQPPPPPQAVVKGVVDTHVIENESLL